jgi:hypothetical protein
MSKTTFPGEATSRQKQAGHEEDLYWSFRYWCDDEGYDILDEDALEKYSAINGLTEVEVGMLKSDLSDEFLSSRKQASSIDGWDVSGDAAYFDINEFQLFVGLANHDDGVEAWSEGDWSVFKGAEEVASGNAGSVNAAGWAAIVAADDMGLDTSAIPASGRTGSQKENDMNSVQDRYAHIREAFKKQADAEAKNLAYAFYDWLSKQGWSGEDLADDNFDWEQVDRILPEFASQMSVTVEDVLDATAQYAPGGADFFARTQNKENDMPNRRRQAEFGRNDQGEWEDTQISQTPPAEPATDPSEGGDAPNDTEEQRVQREDPDNNQLAASIEAMEKQLEAMKKSITAQPIGEMHSDEGGGDVEREDLYEQYEDPSPKDAAYQARRNKDFRTWVAKTQNKRLSEAKSLSELRTWARTYAKLAEIDVSELHEVVSTVAEAKRKQAEARQAELEKPDEKEAKQANRRHAPRRRRVAKRPAQANTEQTKQASPPADDLDIAAPDDRINPEAPTQNVTDDEAQDSQFDKGDFGNNAGDDIAKPDRSLDHQWLPGDGKKSSRQAPKGHETVRLAEAYVAAGLAEKSERWKLATDFENMDRATVLDRTALLERVATVHAATQKKTSGNLGASTRSVIPPNLGGGGGAVTASAMPGESDTDFFYMK